ncbi:MAG: UDP-glucose 6-dehydrogenase, partial [Burkholderiales bacterium]|nr:UDP-glucose 6-dehydrogenase [Burkholderiales bacterium]
RTAGEAGMDLLILDAVERANAAQKQVLGNKILKRFGPELKGLNFALWGLAFKPNTDDLREAPSRVLLAELLARGASVTAYDPVAMPEARHIYQAESRVRFADSPMAALEGADALAIVTEWKEFRSPDFQRIKQLLRTPAVFDGRNLYDPDEVRRNGLEYYPIGRL